MGKNFVTYDQSLALKELGFNEPCFGVFYLNVERKIWEQSRTIQESKHNESDFAISRPLVGQVFEWFIDTIKEFVDYSVSESRFNQALENIFPNNEPIDVKKMGDVIRWVVNDVIKEEMDTMVENQLEPKEINKYISSKVREMFFKMA